MVAVWTVDLWLKLDWNEPADRSGLEARTGFEVRSRFETWTVYLYYLQVVSVDNGC